jgi:beta-glucosidase
MNVPRPWLLSAKVVLLCTLNPGRSGGRLLKKESVMHAHNGPLGATLAALLLAVAALAQTPAPATPAPPPNPAITPMTRADTWWTARNDAINARTRQAQERGDIDIIFLGDSITQGWEGAGKEAWQASFAPLNAVNYGIGADRTGHVLGRIASGNLDGLATPKAGRPPSVVVLLIGTNNTDTDTPEQIASGVETIIDRVREKLPQARVLLTAILPRGEKPGDNLRAKIDRTNPLLARLADGHTVRFLDIGPALIAAGAASPTAMRPANVSVADLSAWVKAAGEDAVLEGGAIFSGSVLDTDETPTRVLRLDGSELHLIASPPRPGRAELPGGPRLFMRSHGGNGPPAASVLFSATGSPAVTPTTFRTGPSDPADSDAIAPLWDFWTTRCAMQTLDRSIFPDFVHLSPKAYQIWADAALPVIREMLGQN